MVWRIHTVWSEAFASSLNILWVLCYWLNRILKFLSLKGVCTGLPESSLVKVPHCWKITCLGSIVLVIFSLLSAGLGSGQRRDSLDFKPRQMTPINQYYGSLGNLGSPAGPMGLVQPGQPMTPPMSGLGSGGRLYSAAPGAEAAKFRSGSVGSNGLFGSLFPGRTMQSRRLVYFAWMKVFKIIPKTWIQDF